MENKIFDLMEKMYGEMQEMKGEMQEVKSRLGIVEKTVLNIENDHGKKLEALFDGYKQNSDQLERVEKKVSSQEEIIIKRIK